MLRFITVNNKEKSLKKNFIYNIILRTLNIVFPIITFPYVARILSPEGIGKVDFSMSIIQYFILLAQLGIPTYAIRECAKVRKDQEKLTKTVQEIFRINFLAVILSYVLFLVMIISIEQLDSYRKILLIASLNIFATSIGIEWFYQAIEEYRYITVRSISVKLISIFSIFIFVKDENDLINYVIITVLSTALGYFYNFIHLRKYIDLFAKRTDLNFDKHLKPILLLFAMSLSVSIYVNLDNVMLGFLSGDASVGLYTAANKLVKVILTLVTSLGTVLLPRMSYYIENNEVVQAKKLIRKSLDFILMISVPATVGLMVLSEPIVLIFAGESYMAATTTIKIISPVIIAIALSNLIGVQILIAYGQEKITLFSTIVGAIINFTLNFMLIPSMQQNGAAIGTVVAEISVTVVQCIFAYSYLKDNVQWKSILSYFTGGLLIIIMTSIINNMALGTMTYTVLSVILSICTYFGFLLLIKNEILVEISNSILMKLKH